MNTFTYYTKVSYTNVCNPNEATNNPHTNSCLSYVVPRPRRDGKTLIQTLEPWTVQEYQGLFFQSGGLRFI